MPNIWRCVIIIAFFAAEVLFRATLYLNVLNYGKMIRIPFPCFVQCSAILINTARSLESLRRNESICLFVYLTAYLWGRSPVTIIGSHDLYENLRTQDQFPLSSTICHCVCTYATGRTIGCTTGGEIKTYLRLCKIYRAIHRCLSRLIA